MIDERLDNLGHKMNVNYQYRLKHESFSFKYSKYSVRLLTCYCSLNLQKY